MSPRPRQSWLRMLAPLWACGLLAACATPARPTRQESAPEPAAVGNSLPSLPLNGEYDVTLHTSWFGPIRARMTAQPTPQGFKANTAPGIAWKLVGGVESVLGPIVTPYLFPQGMLLLWESSLPDSATSTPGEGWIGIATIGPFRARTRIMSPDGPICIQFTDGRTLAAMTVNTPPATAPAPVDYAALVDSLEALSHERLFDPSIPRQPEFAAYYSDLRAAIPFVHDDTAFFFAGGFIWRKYPAFPLPLAYRTPDPASRSLICSCPSPVQPMTVTFDSAHQIATIEALGFRDPALVDAAFAQALSFQPQSLILDLRSCTGFDASALRVLNWLGRTPIDAGVYFGAAARDSATSHPRELPPTLDIATLDDIARVHETLETRRIAHLSALPLANAFSGPVAVLISSRTRSSAEVLAYALQSSGRACVIGQKTAGRPWISREHDIGQGYVALLPEFDWTTADLSRPDGVKPDIRADKASAPGAALRKLLSLRRSVPD